MPAPTAWPFILAFGATLLFAGLVTSMSVSVLGAALALAGCVGWFRAVFPHHAGRNCRSRSRRHSPDHRSPGRGTDSGASGSGASMASSPHVSDLSGCERWIGGQHRNGSVGLCLRRSEGRQYLVSHQSSRRSCLSGIPTDSGPHSCIHFMLMRSRLPLFCTALCPSLLGCSTARCCPCSHVVRLCLEGLLPRCCGPGYCTQSWDC